MSEPKKLYRDTSNKMIAGVCSGLGIYFDIDVTVMRLLVVLIGLITGGVAVLMYIVMIVVVPEMPQDPTTLGKQ